MKKIVIGVTGASGTIYAIDLLKVLHTQPNVETHLVMSKWAKANLALEMPDWQLADVQALADFTYDERDMGAAIASGSFLHDGMVIVPTSMKTVASIASGLGDDLIGRAADVTLKENRPLILVPRETPLSQIHLENLLKLARMGVQIIPPVPAFYNHPQSIADLVAHQTMKVLDHLHLDVPAASRWAGMADAQRAVKQRRQNPQSVQVFTAQAAGYTMMATLTHASQDVLIQLTGGDVPHYGVVTTVQNGKWHTTALRSRPGHVHQEGVLTEALAKVIAPQLQHNAIITGGMHINNINPTQMAAAVPLATELGAQIAAWLPQHPVAQPHVTFAKPAQ